MENGGERVCGGDALQLLELPFSVVRNDEIYRGDVVHARWELLDVFAIRRRIQE